MPSEALRAVRGNVRGLLAFDADLVHTLDAADPELQRAYSNPLPLPPPRPGRSPRTGSG
ncbi:hypothetical protein [Streptomyces tauricus]|uniref:hypothetical protein n=1 Tax=Streptomyces tauricus TaxID=68274 RepID=UPI003412C314